MQKINYLDFDLRIEKVQTGYGARVLDSPAGRGGNQFSLPFSDMELENILLRIGRIHRTARHHESPEMTTARDFGKRLFEAVFSKEVLDRLRDSLEEAGRSEVGLRIRLRLADVPELADLPWEYLYDSVQDRFFALSVETPIVRYIELPQHILPLTVKPPLGVLVMVSNPTDCPQLDVEKEWEKLKEALQDLEDRKLVSLRRLERATLTNLQRQLRQRECHILHYIGHGGFDQDAQDGILILEDERGRGRPVNSQTLGMLLHDCKSLRLAILNACEGARTSRTEPFAGVAQSLIQQGVPAVVAMQFEITDEAAITFAHEFYGALADGYPVDAALAEARKMILAQENNTEWGTPVLHLSAPDGRIFDIARPPSGTSSPPLESSDKELERRLEQLYTDGLSAFLLEEWEEACRSFQAIVSIRPDYQDANAKLAAARRWMRLGTLYTQAVTAQEAGNWQASLVALNELARIESNFKDVSARLKEVKRQKRLGDLYNEARSSFQARHWEKVIEIFNAIMATDPNYPDPEGLFPTAERELAALKRQAELETFYSQAVRKVDVEEWEAARQLLFQVQDIQPSFRDTERLLRRVETKIAEKAKIAEQEKLVAALYTQALAFVHAQQWRQALLKMEEIYNLDAQFADSEGVATRARDEVAKEDLEAQRQTMLATLYIEAVQLLRAKQYHAALAKWNEIQTQCPNYPDPQNVQVLAMEKLGLTTPIFAILLITLGWFSARFLIERFGEIIYPGAENSLVMVEIMLAFFGMAGGAVLWWALGQASISLHWKQALVIIIGWTISLPLAGAFSNSNAILFSVLGDSFWKANSALGQLISSLGFGLGSVIGGLIMGMVLQQVEPSFQKRQLQISLVGWAVGFMIGNLIIMRVGKWGGGTSPYLALGIESAVAGIIGGSVIFDQLKNRRGNLTHWKTTLAGCVGFAIGNAVFMHGVFRLLGEKDTATLAALASWGVMGGAFLAIPSKTLKRVLISGLLGGIGMWLGGLISRAAGQFPGSQFFLGPDAGIFVGSTTVLNLILGLMLGLALGIGTKRAQLAILISLVGAIAFLITAAAASLVQELVSWPLILEPALWLLVDIVDAGIIGGILGFALSYFEVKHSE